MNWDTFWPDLLVAVLSALIAVGVALASYLIGVYRRERHALQALIKELHERRALNVDGIDRPRFGARRRSEFYRINDSILAVREEINRTRHLVREAPKIQGPLRSMRLACNQYLERSERDPNSYIWLAGQLQCELTKAVVALTTARHRLLYMEPGKGAFPSKSR